MAETVKRSVALFMTCENAAFGTTPQEMNDEIKKIFENFLYELDRTHVANPSFNLRDVNGNKVGFVVIRHDIPTEVVT